MQCLTYLVADIAEMDHIFGLDEFFFFFAALDFLFPGLFQQRRVALQRRYSHDHFFGLLSVPVVSELTVLE